ncbi:MAG: ABC transporter permease [Alphaproteobacteria bacterium]|nr:ABC transporter permease [Alphaproteobacteria bacterium]
MKAESAAEFERQRQLNALKVAMRLRVDRAIAVAVPLVLWQLASHWVGKKWISSPVDVAQRIWFMLLDGSLELHTWETFKEAIIGLAIGVVLGVVFGIVLGLWRRLSDAVDPVVMGLYSLPRVSLAPLFIIWLGIGLFAKVALVASMVVFVVLFNVREGVRSIDREIIDAFRSMNASRAAVIRHVIVPSLVPWLLTAIRIGIGMALVGAVVGEMIGASRGLGWYVNHTSGVYDMTGSITALVILMILAMIFNGVLALIERRVLRWRRGSDAWITT